MNASEPSISKVPATDTALTTNTALATLRQHWRLWLVLTGACFVGYHALLMAALVIRFHGIPNYLTVYTLLHNYAQILHSTPAFSDALSIMAQEPWIEVGYRDPAYFNIAEWSFMLMPVHGFAIAVAAALMATALVLALRHATSPARGTCRACVVATGVGGGLLGLANATLTWVVCCATPSWVVALSMFGLSVGVAQTLRPYGTWLALAGLALCTVAIMLLIRTVRRAPPAF